MFQANVPEKIIQSITAHSVDALRKYERVSTEQHQVVSKVLMFADHTSLSNQVSY